MSSITAAERGCSRARANFRFENRRGMMYFLVRVPMVWFCDIWCEEIEELSISKSGTSELLEAVATKDGWRSRRSSLPCRLHLLLDCGTLWGCEGGRTEKFFPCCSETNMSSVIPNFRVIRTPISKSCSKLSTLLEKIYALFPLEVQYETSYLEENDS